MQNKSPQPFVYQIHRNEGDAWSDSYSVPSGWEQAIPTSSPVAIRFHNGQEWITNQLAPGKLFRYRQDGAGAGRLFDAGKVLFADWMQDFRAAQHKAARENKDIILLLDGSDWARFSIRMADEVFAQQEFSEKVASSYVLVHVDFPKHQEGRTQVEDRQRNEKLAKEFGLKGVPTVFVTDSAGLPYGQMHYVPGGVRAFWAKLNEMKAVRNEVRTIMKEIDQAEAADKLAPIAELVKLLAENNLIRYQERLLQQWLDLARAHDGQNAKGVYELVFAHSWLARMSTVDPPNADRLRTLLNELDRWKSGNSFQNPDTAAMVHLSAAAALCLVKDAQAASQYVDAGLAYQPRNPKLLANLQTLRGSIDGGLGSGTGFAVGPGGYLLTNHHVVNGAHKLVVRLPQRPDPVSAAVVAKDLDHDLALLKIELPGGTQLQPLAVTAGNVHRGTKIAVFGYPLANFVGTALKLTTGVVSAPADQVPAGMILLDCRVNPGNSGGPLCDAHGNVVGIVTAKSRSSALNDSYGMARPAQQIGAFLKKNLPGFQLQTAPTMDARSEEWDVVDRRVSPSVVMVIRAS